VIHALFLTWDFTAGHFDYEFCCMEIVEACRDLLLQFFRSFHLEMEVRLKRNSPLSLLLMAEVPFPVSFRVYLLIEVLTIGAGGFHLQTTDCF